MKWLGVLLGCMIMAGGASAQEQGRPRSCEEERDQLRVLSRMLGDHRGMAELSLAEAIARVQRLEAEVTALKKLLPPAGEKK